MQTTLTSVQSRPESVEPSLTQPILEKLALRSAFDTLVTIDSRADHQTVLANSLSFLKHVRAVIADPQRVFTDQLLSHCCSVRSGEKQRTLTQEQVAQLKPTILPPEIWRGLIFEKGRHQYHSPHGRLFQDQVGEKAFQRDYLKLIDLMKADIESKQAISMSQAQIVGQMASDIITVCSTKLLGSNRDKGFRAAELTRLIKATQAPTPELLKLCISSLKGHSDSSLESLTAALVKRIKEERLYLPPEVEASLLEWGKRGEVFDPTALSHDEMTALFQAARIGIGQLLQSEIDAKLQVLWMLSVLPAQRRLEYIYDNEDRGSANESKRPAYPAENIRFSKAVRATMPELNDLKRASELLGKENLTGLHLEIDQSPFVWPRIAEALLVSKPTSVTLHSPTANQPFGEQDIANVPPYLCLREEHYLPLTLATSPRTILEYDVNLAAHAAIDWSSPSTGTALVGDTTITFSIDDVMGLGNQVRKQLKDAKINTSCFILRDPKAALSDPPLAFATFFTQVIRPLSGYTCHNFGKTIQVFIANDRKPTATTQPEPASVVEIPQIAPAPSELAPSVEPLGPVQPTPQTEPVVIKKVKKEPTPPPVRDPRPKISEDQALAAKVIVAALPGVQNIARSSKALTPVVPFKEPEISTALNILKNGERPGSKALKALRHYVNDDSNFKDCLHGARTVREDLKSLLAGLLD